MEKLFEICSFDHDFDGSIYIEDRCNCIICKENEEYYLRQCGACRRDMGTWRGGAGYYYLSKQDLNKTIKDFCNSDCAKERVFFEWSSRTIQEHIQEYIDTKAISEKKVCEGYEIVDYTEDMGSIHFQEGFLEQLRGKSIKEQVRCYAWGDVEELVNDM